MNAKESNIEGVCRKCGKSVYVHETDPMVGDGERVGDFCDNELCGMYRILIAP